LFKTASGPKPLQNHQSPNAYASKEEHLISYTEDSSETNYYNLIKYVSLFPIALLENATLCSRLASGIRTCTQPCRLEKTAFCTICQLFAAGFRGFEGRWVCVYLNPLEST
jgi:hypothetical protein